MLAIGRCDAIPPAMRLASSLEWLIQNPEYVHLEKTAFDFGTCTQMLAFEGTKLTGMLTPLLTTFLIECVSIICTLSSYSTSMYEPRL